MNLSRMMIDRMFIESHGGSRHGPFKTRFGGDTLLVFREELLIREGDRIVQPLSDGSEISHLVEGFSYNPPRGKIPAHFSIRIVRASDIVAPEKVSNVGGTAEIATHDIAAALEALELAIESGPFSAQEKGTAIRMLHALQENEIIARVLKRGD